MLRHHLSRKCIQVTNLILVLIFSFPMALAAVYAYLAYEAEDVASLWIYGYDIYNKNYRAAVHFICSYTYFANCAGFPCHVTLSVCLLVHNYGYILIRMKKHLSTVHITDATVMHSRILEDYSIMEEKFRVLQDSLSFPLFLLLLICFLNLFTVLSAGLQLDIAAHHMVELCSCTVTGTAILFTLAYFCCKISDQAMEMKVTVGSFIDKHQFSYFKGVKDVFLLYRVEKKDVIYLSACGIINFKRNFLPSVVGTLFTYGLLISNLKVKRD
ncbi:hypothetical protein HNY73_020176 [Argiope bruennichi]|uniref:Uncharacterized protein n=1 Tax=Argiope bruennichi TaxID=94029 RepID=A0A8T0E746_ARGBR|nr:hypothetical protein HNY73_020176 [Argiope bruennichi]